MAWEVCENDGLILEKCAEARGRWEDEGRRCSYTTVEQMRT